MKLSAREEVTTQQKVSVAVLILMPVLLGFAHKTLAATSTPLAGLEQVTLIPIPTWTTSGATQASTDIFSFDPSTHTMYFADRVNKGVSVIDTETNTYLGTIVVPGCDGTGSCPSGVLVAPDLHKLVVTDRLIGAGPTLKDLNHIFIFDLKLGQFTPPDGLSLPSGQDSDELEYDPLNHRAYVANTKAPFFLTVVDLITNTIVDQIPLPSNPEQPRFNPVDGMIYQTIPDDGGTIPTGGPNDFVLRIDPQKTGAAAIVAKFAPPAGCAVRGIDVDALTNTAIIGCALGAPQFQMDLSNGAILAEFPDVTGTDTLYFNANLRRWYTASSNNTNSGVQCPQDTTGVFPVVGVFEVHAKAKKATVVGAECSGRNGHGIGVDPINNQIYVGARQFPADPKNPDSGKPGVLVFHDPANLAQPELVSQAHANLASLAGQQGNGIVFIGDNHIVRGRIANLPSDKSTVLNITTTIGNEVVSCDTSGGNATCAGVLRGEALINGVVFLATDGTPLASGTIARGNGGFGNL